MNQSNVIGSLIEIHSSPKYVKAILKSHGGIGGLIDELLRHHPTLRPNAIASCIKMLEDVLAFASEKEKEEKTENEDTTLVDMINNVGRVCFFYLW